MNWGIAVVAVPSLLVSWVTALAVCRLAPKWGLVDRPGHRKVHRRPVPFGGGLAIWAGVVVPMAVLQGALAVWERARHADPAGGHLDVPGFGPWATRLAEFIEPHLPGMVEQSASLWFLLSAATVLMLLGLADDLRKLDWRFRLLIETLVAAAVVLGDGWELDAVPRRPLVHRRDRACCGSWD